MSVPEWVTLGEGEYVVWSGSPSLFLAAGPLLGGFLVAVAGVVLYGVLPADLAFRWVTLLLIPLSLALMSYAYVRHRSTRYVVTTNEVYRKEGLFTRQVASLRLDRIQNTSFEQSLLERLFAYGDVHVDTAGSGDTEITFEAVSDPQGVNSLLTEQLDRMAAR